MENDTSNCDVFLGEIKIEGFSELNFVEIPATLERLQLSFFRFSVMMQCKLSKKQ